MTIRIAVLGRGRMGRALERCIAASDDLALSGVWVRKLTSKDTDSHSVQSTELSAALSESQVAIDFTLSEVNEQVVQAAIEAQIPLVCGVSGLSASMLQQMQTAAQQIPILHDRNMSLGIAVLQQMVQMAGAVLGDEFAAEIHETHHIHKIDAPSGTALQLGEALAESRQQSFAEACHYDPCGTSKPGKGQIHFEVSRHGEVAGEHTVQFKSASESLTLTHKVADRMVFAVGAIKAARWLLGQKPGLYCMQDVIRNQKPIENLTS